jgi:hypothetical protein
MLERLWLLWLSGWIELNDFPSPEERALLYPGENWKPERIGQIIFD